MEHDPFIGLYIFVLILICLFVGLSFIKFNHSNPVVYFKAHTYTFGYDKEDDVDLVEPREGAGCIYEINDGIFGRVDKNDGKRNTK